MKKNLIALSVAAMVGGLAVSTGAHADVVARAGTAQDLMFNTDGIGHALIVPYFNVQNGNMSVFHVVNTDTSNGKAVKIRFRGASNSDDVFDFQVYMSPGDVFTGAVTQAASGAATFFTADTSCTIPASVNQDFVLSRLSDAEQVAGAGSREGYIEIFTMADIPATEAALTNPADVNNDGDTADTNILYTAIKHVDGVPPCGLTTAGSRLATLLSTNTDAATTLNPATQAGTDTSSAHVKGMDHPTPSLVGSWYIINVDEALSYSGNATATLGVIGNAAAAGNIVFWPQRDFTVGGTTDVAIAAAVGANPAINGFSADPLLKMGGTAAGIAAGGVEPRAFDLPDMSTPYTQDGAGNSVLPWVQAFNLNSALALTSIINEFATDAAISAASDWVFSMPARRYNAAVRYNDGTTGTGAPAAIYTDLATGFYSDDIVTGAFDGFDTATTAGYTDAANFFNTTNTALVGEQLCVSDIGIAYTDREEGEIASPAVDFVISPSTPEATPEVLFCGETSVLKFNVANTATSVLGAALATQGIEMTFNEAGDTYSNGWATLTTTGLAAKGLPIVGSYFLKAVNPATAAGVSANYGLIFPHRGTRP